VQLETVEGFLTQTMASANDFTHQLAIKLSRILNIVNPNDLLARTVIELAKTNPPEGFAKGAFLVSLNLLVSGSNTECRYSGSSFWQVSGFFFGRIAFRDLVP
jgi:hypothetical protein